MEHAEQSEAVDEVAAALAKAQASIGKAAIDGDAHVVGKSKSGTRIAYDYTYSTLGAVFDACKAALAAESIAVVQLPRVDGNAVAVVTRLVHSSGQWFRSELRLPVAKFDAQGIGSAITYARRYSLSAMVGVAPGDDDDAQAAIGAPVGGPVGDDRRPVTQPKPKPEQPVAVAGADWPESERLKQFMHKAVGCQSEADARVFVRWLAANGLAGVTLENIRDDNAAAVIRAHVDKLAEAVPAAEMLAEAKQLAATETETETTSNGGGADVAE